MRNKTSINKKLRSKRHLFDAYIRQKLLRKHFGSPFPRGANGNEKPPLENDKEDDLDDFEYDPEDVWMAYVVQQQMKMSKYSEAQKTANKSDTAQETFFVEMVKNHLRFKTVFDDFEKPIVGKLLEMCQSKVREFIQNTLNDKKVQSMKDVNVGDFNSALQKHRYNNNYRCTNYNFYKHRTFIKMDDLFANSQPIDETTITEFIRLFIASINPINEYYEWPTWTDSYGNKHPNDNYFDYRLYSVGFWVLNEIDLMQAQRSLIPIARELSTSLYQPYLDAVSTFIDHLNHMRNKLRHEHVISTLNILLVDRENFGKAGVGNLLFTSDYVDWIKKVLSSKCPDDVQNKLLTGLQIMLPANEANETSDPMIDLTAISFPATQLQQWSFRQGGFRQGRNESNENFLIRLMTAEPDLLQRYLSGFRQAFKKKYPQNRLTTNVEAKRMKIVLLNEIFGEAVIDGTKLPEFLTKFEKKYKKEKYRIALNTSQDNARLWAFKGVDNTAVEDFEKFLSVLQSVAYERGNSAEERRVLTNLLSCAQSVWRSDDAHFNYHLLRFHVGHRGYNRYIVAEILHMTSASFADDRRTQSFVRRTQGLFFELGVYSAFHKFQEEKALKANMAEITLPTNIQVLKTEGETVSYFKSHRPFIMPQPHRTQSSNRTQQQQVFNRQQQMFNPPQHSHSNMVQTHQNAQYQYTQTVNNVANPMNWGQQVPIFRSTQPVAHQYPHQHPAVQPQYRVNQPGMMVQHSRPMFSTNQGYTIIPNPALPQLVQQQRYVQPQQYGVQQRYVQPQQLAAPLAVAIPAPHPQQAQQQQAQRHAQQLSAQQQYVVQQQQLAAQQQQYVVQQQQLAAQQQQQYAAQQQQAQHQAQRHVQQQCDAYNDEWQRSDTYPGRSMGVSKKRKSRRRKLSSAQLKKMIMLNRKIVKYEKNIQQLDEIINYNQEFLSKI